MGAFDIETDATERTANVVRMTDARTKRLAGRWDSASPQPSARPSGNGGRFQLRHTSVDTANKPVCADSGPSRRSFGREHNTTRS